MKLGKKYGIHGFVEISLSEIWSLSQVGFKTKTPGIRSNALPNELADKVQYWSSTKTCVYIYVYIYVHIYRYI